MSEQRSSLDQDLLVAYADGELPAEEAAAVAAALERDEVARHRLRLMQLGGQAVAHAYDRVLDMSVPVCLLAAAGADGDMVAPRSATRRSRWRESFLLIAASLTAFAIGFGGGYWLRAPAASYVPAATQAVDPLTAGFQVVLWSALDRGAEGQSFTYRGADLGEGEVTLGHSFTTGFGVPCREFRRQETRAGQRGSAQGLACRGPDQGWNVMLLNSGR
jgi:hypothetical protein